MKNIHLIKTDKSSRLFLNKVNNKLLLEDIANPNLKKVLPSGTYQNIYITSYEEIKDGDWILYCNSVYKVLRINSNNRPVVKMSDGEFELSNWNKIILTTDQDLIKDGVQPIDDEFLEWFIKNPSCEEISIEWLGTYTYGIVGYKIIIPKEEPKQGYVKSETEFLGIEFTLKDGSKQFVPNLKEEPKQEQEVCNHCGKTLREQMKGCGEITCYRQFLSKQETLEEAGAIAAGLCEHLEAKEQAMFIAGFQECLKWQKERRYSEKEVEMIARDAYEIGRKNILIGVLNK